MVMLPLQQSGCPRDRLRVRDPTLNGRYPARSATMPTYEYACPTCGIVEVFQSIKEAALTKCPNCKKAKVQRMVSQGAGVIFKGSGFWETDYNRSSDYAAKQKNEGKPAGDAKPPGDTKPAKDSKSGSEPKPDTPQPKPQVKPAMDTKPTPPSP
jgi:putative FmdB family regulatory protein